MENLRLLSLAMPVADGNFVARIDGANCVFKRIDPPKADIIAFIDPNNQLLYCREILPEQAPSNVSLTPLLSAVNEKGVAIVEVENPVGETVAARGLRFSLRLTLKI